MGKNDEASFFRLLLQKACPTMTTNTIVGGRIMTQFVTESPALRKAAQKAQGILQLAFWPMAALLFSRTVLFGTVWPAAGALVLATPMPLLALCAAGGVLGSMLRLSAGEAAKQIAVIAAAGLARIVLRDKGGKLSAAAGAVALLLTEIILQLRLGGTFAESLQALLQAGFVLLFAVCVQEAKKTFLRGGTAYILKKNQGCVMFAAVVVTASLVPLSIWNINLAAAALTGGLLLLASQKQWQYMLSLALCGAAVFPAADIKLLAFGLSVAGAGVVLFSLRPQKRTALAATGVIASMWGGFVVQSGEKILLCMAAASLAGAVFLVLPAVWCEKQTAQDDAVSVCSEKLMSLSRALADINDTITEVCTALPAQNKAVTLEDTLCNGICRNCRYNCGCWVENGGTVTDAVLQIERQGTLNPEGLPAALVKLCHQPIKLSSEIQSFFTRRLAGRFAATKTDALRTAVTEQLSALCQTLGDTAAQLDAPPPVLHYRVELATEGDAAANVSADAARTGTDSNGKLHLILADGTGTGSAAAVDGAMAVSLTRRLLTAGFDPEPAARLVNIALNLTGNESSATLDVVSLDLTNGDCKVYKAGAATTFFVRSGRVGALSACSLPVGMLGEVQADTFSMRLVPGDLVVLVSDGMLAGGEEWLAGRLEKIKESSPRQIAQRLLEEAKKRRQGRADDMTVTVAKVEKYG